MVIIGGGVPLLVMVGMEWAGMEPSPGPERVVAPTPNRVLAAGWFLGGTGRTIWVIDAGMETISAIPVPFKVSQLEADPKRPYVYASGSAYDSAAGTRSMVAVIDAAAGRVVGTAEVMDADAARSAPSSGGVLAVRRLLQPRFVRIEITREGQPIALLYPYGDVFNRTGTLAFATAQHEFIRPRPRFVGEIQVRDATAGFRVVETLTVWDEPVGSFRDFPITFAGFNGFAGSPAGDRAYAAVNLLDRSNMQPRGELVVVDTARPSIVGRIPLPAPPSGIAVDPAGNRVYVSLRNGSVQAVDLSAGKVSWTVEVGRDPAGLTVDPSGSRLYVADRKLVAVSAIDTTTGKVVSQIGPCLWIRRIWP